MYAKSSFAAIILVTKDMKAILKFHQYPHPTPLLTPNSTIAC